MDARTEKQWSQALYRFVQLLTLSHGRQLVMKSPPHTARVGELLRLFPQAKFVHLVRNPYELFPSTQRLWQSLDQIQGLQVPHHRELNTYIFDTLRRMYHSYDRDREALDDNQLCEICYEDLTQDPMGQLEKIYQQLELGDFQQARPQLENRLGKQRDYRVNQHDLDTETRAEIAENWGFYFERYGYSV